jgi:hypothetical protein
MPKTDDRRVERMNQTYGGFTNPNMKNQSPLLTSQSFGIDKESSAMSLTPTMIQGTTPLEFIQEEEMEWIKAVKTIHI